MIRQAYCTLEALEEIYAFQDEQPYDTLHQLLETHHHICVHLPDDEFDTQLAANKCLLYFAKRASTRKGYDLSNTAIPYQQTVAMTASSELAGTVFVVDDNPATCAQWSADYGVCIVSNQDPAAAEYLTQELARKEIRIAKSYRNTVSGVERTGWYSALNPRLKAWQASPLNSLVIVDNYLLGDKGDKLATGKENLISLLDTLLPDALSIDFHLLIVTNNESGFLKARNLNLLADSIRKVLNRTYRIEIGVVTRDDAPEHRRVLVSNYYFGASHHGFACFKGHTPQWPNDFVVSGLFSGVAEPGFDVPWISMHDELRAVRIQRDKNRKLRNPTSGYDDPTHLAFGFCDNRLLELVS
jgi:hypothetical protein